MQEESSYHYFKVSAERPQLMLCLEQVRDTAPVGTRAPHMILGVHLVWDTAQVH